MTTTATRRPQIVGWHCEGTFPALFTDSVSIAKRWLENDLPVSELVRLKDASLDAPAGLFANVATALGLDPEHVSNEQVIYTAERQRDALIWVLWHHQGGSSSIGQPIRRLLEIAQHAHLTDEQYASARRFASTIGQNTSECPINGSPDQVTDAAQQGKGGEA